MKRNLTNLTKREIKCIENWIEKREIDSCPFQPITTLCYLKGQRCKDLFPSVIIRNSVKQYDCPCCVISGSYVLKTAKQILKDLENERLSHSRS